MSELVILFDRSSNSHDHLVRTLEDTLNEFGLSTHVDRHLRISVDWARSVDEKIRSASAVIAVISPASLQSEMLRYELEVLADARLKNPAIRFICVPVAPNGLKDETYTAGSVKTSTWDADSDIAVLIAQLIELLRQPAKQSVASTALDTAGGAVGWESPYYLERDADTELKRCLNSREPTVLVKGARQTGKSSLLAQGVQFCRENGILPLVTDFQRMGSNLQANENELYLSIARSMTRQFHAVSNSPFEWTWEDGFTPTSNLDEFMISLLTSRSGPIVWFLDEADWVFSTGFADGFFALIRSWHNAHALSTDPVWRNFSVVISYATEAHLFIQDINQSPFNVGKKINLAEFTLRQTEELNQRYGEPLRGIDQVHQLQDLLDGQPFLTRTAFDSLVKSHGHLRGLIVSADQEDGPFGDHLRRILVSVSQLSTVRNAVKKVLDNQFVESSPDVDRLVAAGILTKNSVGNHLIRCKLYRRYLERHLI